VNFRHVIGLLGPALLGVGLLSCGSSNPNIGRVLTSVTVTPASADGHSNPNGVVFTATGTFSLPPFSAPLTFAAPYSGQFVVDNPTGTTIANITTTGTGTITVQCATGASGTVFVNASALANNGTSTLISGNAQLTCP
jgi:2-methylaconitate cis-trans-isomerase PrpF